MNERSSEETLGLTSWPLRVHLIVDERTDCYVSLRIDGGYAVIAYENLERAREWRPEGENSDRRKGLVIVTVAFDRARELAKHQHMVIAMCWMDHPGGPQLHYID